MGAKSRRKGRRFEQELVRWFKAWRVEAKRGYQSRGGGAEQADVILPGLPYHIEAKRMEKSAVYKHIEQAYEDCWRSAAGGIPVVLLKADRKPALAIMYARDWLSKAVLKDDELGS